MSLSNKIIALFGLLFIAYIFYKAYLAAKLSKREGEEKGYTEYKWWEWCLLVPYRNKDARAKVPIWLFIPVLILSIISILVVLVMVIASIVVIF